MKRSEMVKQIAIELRDIVKENYIDEQGEEWCADLILLRMEELGIKPPETLVFSEPEAVYLNIWDDE